MEKETILNRIIKATLYLKKLISFQIQIDMK